MGTNGTRERRPAGAAHVMALCLSLALVLLLVPPSMASSPVPPSQDALQAYKDGALLTAAQAGQLRPWTRTDPAPLHIVGPDNEGYIAIDSDEDHGPTYSWIDISGSGTEFAGELGDEDVYGPIDLGFGFPFYNETHSQVWVQSNGTLTFEPGAVLPLNQQLPLALYGPMVAWFWDDMDPDYGQDGCEMYYETQTINDQPVFILSVIGLDEYPDGPNQDTVTAQIRLYANGRVQIHYQHLDPGLDIGSCTVGIQNSDGDVGTTYLFNGDPEGLPRNELAVEFHRLFPSAFLTGVVRDSTTNAPIPFALVSSQDRWAVTDWGGRYLMFSLYPGADVPVTATAWGYTRRTKSTNITPWMNTCNFQVGPWPPPTHRDYLTTLEPNLGRMQAEGTNNHWSWGTATVEPDSALSGQRVWANRLNQDYGLTQRDWLVTRQSFVVDDAAAMLRYRHWYDIEAGYDGYNVHVSRDNGLTWDVLQPEGGYSDLSGVPANDFQPCYNNEPFGATDGWETVVMPLADYVDQQIWIGFYFVSDGFVNHPGVAIDDIEIFLRQRRSRLAVYTDSPVDSLGGFGGVIYHHAIASSDLEGAYPLDLWTMLLRPDGILTGPHNLINATLSPGLTTVPNLTLTLHPYDPNGIYRMISYVGLYPDQRAARSVLTIVKQPQQGAGEAMTVAGTSAEPAMPDQPRLAVHPNPFNDLATVSVSLPRAGEVRVELLSIEGRRVAVLTDGPHRSGEHRFAVDGRHLASGVYFVRAAMSGGDVLTKKLVLLK